MTEDTPNLTSTAIVLTPKAAGYLVQLCKHFAHKIPATWEGGDGSKASGQITFSAGGCALQAEDEQLTMTVDAATPDGIALLEDVVARHLVRFAFRETLVIDWRRNLPAE